MTITKSDQQALLFQIRKVTNLTDVRNCILL